MIRRFAIPLLALIASAAALPAFTQEFVPLRGAIPDFDTDRFSADYARGISKVIREDLLGSGAFSLIDRRDFIEKDVDITLMPRFGAWTALNARMLVIGNVKGSEAEGITVQFRVWDPYQERQIDKGQLTAPDPADWEDLAHRAAEDIRQGLTRRRS